MLVPLDSLDHSRRDLIFLVLQGPKGFWSIFQMFGNIAVSGLFLNKPVINITILCLVSLMVCNCRFCEKVI